MTVDYFVLTCDKYSHLISGFAYLFNKFWSKDQVVTILGYEKCPSGLPKNFIFNSLGREEDFGVGIFTDGLLKYFSKCSADYLVIALDDYYLTRDVNFHLFNHLLTYLGSTVKVAKIELHEAAERLGFTRILESFQGTKIYERKQESEYRNSLQWSIWRKDYFCKFLVPGRTPWQFEMHGQSLARNDGETILGISFYLGGYVDLYHKGKLSEYSLKEFSQETREELQSKGFLPKPER